MAASRVASVFSLLSLLGAVACAVVFVHACSSKNGNPSDTLGSGDGGGCGKDLANDPDNCGACGIVCYAGPNATPACSGGKCTLACRGGWANCSGNLQDGCRLKLDSDTNNCGACGHKCAPFDGGIAICSGGKCGSECPDGGGLTACGGACVSTATDSKNCGACGHDCGGGTCSSGSCQAVTLASGQSSPTGIAIDKQFVYWAGGSSVMKVAIGGGNAQQLASGQINAWGIAVDGTNVYWSNSGTQGQTDGKIKWCAESGACTPADIPKTPTLGQPQALAVGGTGLFWVDFGDGQIWQAETNPPGNPVNLTLTPPPTPSPQQPWAIAADATNIYWTDFGKGAGTGSVYQSDHNGGGVTTIAAAQAAPAGIAVDAQNVYWVNSGDGSVWSRPIAGGNPTQLATKQPAPRFIAVDSTNVYFTNSGDGTVMRCATGGCNSAPATIASGQAGAAGIAADGANVYWAATGAGTIMKLVK